MKEEEKIAAINKVISDYFEENKTENVIAVKELMPSFIQAGIFTTDHRKGKPIREVLVALDKEKALDKIPLVHAERKDKNTFWYFVRDGSTYISDAPNDTGVTKKQKRRASIINGDEYYVVNLCDELLEEHASRQHRFSFLLGDYHKDGINRSILPVDAYYQNHNLVIEYMESVESSGTPYKRTISGVGLTEQRKLYDERRRKGLKSNEINLLEIQYSSFECNSENQLIRDHEKDMNVLRALLKEYL